MKKDKLILKINSLKNINKNKSKKKELTKLIIETQ